MLGKYPQVDIDETYFAEDADCSMKEVNAILSATPFDLSLATKRRRNLQTQLDFVTRKASQIILDRQQSYAIELSRVLELEAALRQAQVECHTARTHLSVAKSVFTDRGLYLLGNCRRRRQLLVLLRSLLQIRCIRGTSARLASFLSDNDYSSAIELGVACQKEASSLSRFACLKDTSLKLQDALQSVEETMDSALSKHCINFDPSSFAKLQAGYSLLGPGKLQVAADQLIMHAVNTLQDRCYSVLAGYAVLTHQDGDGSQGSLGSLSAGRPFADVCRVFSTNMDPTIVIAGVRDCAEAAWQIMSNYLRICQWHSSSCVVDQQESTSKEEEEQPIAAAEDYVKMKLNIGRGRIWQEVDGRIRVLLNALCLDHFGSENFLQLLEVLRVLPLCGQWFAESESPGIDEAISQLAGRFFRSFHLRSLEETRTFFDNETWTICPLPKDFSIWSLPELKTLSKQGNIQKRSVHIDFDALFKEDSSPFTSLLSPSRTTNRDRGMSLALGFGDDVSSGNASSSDDPNQYAPVANATISVIRLMAQYVCLLQPLSTVAMDIITGVADLFDQYLYSVFQLIRIPSSEHPLPSVLHPQSQRLSATLIRIQEQHGNNLSYVNPLSVTPPVCAHRILAAESVVFLGSQVDQLKSILEKHVPEGKAPFLLSFYSQSVKPAEDIRMLAYFPIGANLIDAGTLVQRVSVVNFEPSDIQSQHSQYVDWIIQSIQSGVDRLTVAVNQAGIPCPQSVRTVVISAALRCATFYLLEGYAQVKRCKGEGRALMQLDVEQLSKVAERKLGAKPPLPGRDLLDHFIRAYYLRDDTELETWMREHPFYSSMQLQGLIVQLPWLTARAKKRLSDLVTASSQLPAPQ